MPDKYNFDNLTNRGALTFRCIECGWPDIPRSMSEEERSKHFAKHEQLRRSHSANAKRERMAQARIARAIKKIENERAYDSD